MNEYFQECELGELFSESEWRFVNRFQNFNSLIRNFKLNKRIESFSEFSNQIETVEVRLLYVLYEIFNILKYSAIKRPQTKYIFSIVWHLKIMSCS